MLEKGLGMLGLAIFLVFCMDTISTDMSVTGEETVNLTKAMKNYGTTSIGSFNLKLVSVTIYKPTQLLPPSGKI